MNYKDLRSLLLRRFNLPKERSARTTIRSFTMAEKATFFFFVVIFTLSGVALLWKVSEAFLAEVPTQGGSLMEGVVGNPRFINPVLAISEADRNLGALTYSGLVRITPDGTVVNDLAEKITVSDDRTIYTARINPEARFHDGSPVTSDDVIFTIQKIVDPVIKSPRRGNWDGVAVEKVDDLTVTFTLKQAYTPFIYNLTIGILPRHIWKNVSDDEFSFSQFNTFPIGSGPYKIDQVERNSGGIPNFYKLTPFYEVVGARPYIKQLIFKFYQSEPQLIEAYNEGEVESLSGISPENLLDLNMEKAKIISSPLPRVFAVFFNQNQSKVLLNKEVRRALDIATPKEKIINEVLLGYGNLINGPFPAGLYTWTEDLKVSSSSEEKLFEAQNILTEDGWKPNSETGVLEKKSSSGTLNLSFSISTGDAPELQKVADELATTWKNLGAEVKVHVFETGDLNQNVIRPRNFDALLFGEVVGRDADLYPFWHSSQRTDPGLNIALYANNRADNFLEEARKALNVEDMEENYRAFTEELRNDIPAIFLYTPSFLYVVPEKVKAINLGSLTVSQDRFLGIRSWYIETDKIWKIFID